MTRTVLVTGAQGGIGGATALAFAEEGARLVLFGRRPDVDGEMVDAVLRAGAQAAEWFSVDLGAHGALEEALSEATDRFGPADAIVNVAGRMIYREVRDLDAADWRDVLDVNLVGTALVVGHGLRTMRPGSSIVNVSSVHARRTTPLVAAYAATKAALTSLTRSAAIEGRALGIRVNAILPGAIETKMLRSSPAIESGAEVLDDADVGAPEDIAALALFLCSEGAGFITGEEVVADNGRMGRL